MALSQFSSPASSEAHKLLYAYQTAPTEMEDMYSSNLIQMQMQMQMQMQGQEEYQLAPQYSRDRNSVDLVSLVGDSAPPYIPQSTSTTTITTATTCPNNSSVGGLPFVDLQRVDLDHGVDRKGGSSRKRRPESEEGATPSPQMDDGESEDSSSNKRHRCSNKSIGGPKLGGGKPNKCAKENGHSHSHSHSPPTSSRSTKDSSKQSKSGVVDPTQDYVHVRARRGQATDSHSLAERVRREKISERMKFLQDLVPGCNKTIGKAMMLDEIINYVQSLQHQIEFLSMKLAALNPKIEFDIESLIGGIGEMSPNAATTNTMEATNNVEQLGSMCDMVFNPSTNMSFQMLLQTPLPPEDSTSFPKSLPTMLNIGNVQSTSIPQLPSAWDSRGLAVRRDDMLFYGSAPTEPSAGGNHHPSMTKVEF